jgi:hypothetical protein
MAASPSASRAPHKRKLTKDDLRLVAAHEAGHAVAYIEAFKDMGLDWSAFDRVLIRPDISKPHVDQKGRKVQCVGMVEASNIYCLVTGRLRWENALQLELQSENMLQLRPELKNWKLRPELKKQMEWEIIVSLAGPFAEAAARGDRTKTNMRYTALLFCGAGLDYHRAENVLKDYKWATKGRVGLRRFEDRARELVLTEWPAIEALSAALLKSNILTYEQVLPIITHARSGPVLRTTALPKAPRPAPARQSSSGRATTPTAASSSVARNPRRSPTGPATRSTSSTSARTRPTAPVGSCISLNEVNPMPKAGGKWNTYETKSPRRDGRSS